MQRRVIFIYSVNEEDKVGNEKGVVRRDGKEACRNLDGSDLGLTSLRGHFNAFARVRPDAGGEAHRLLHVV